MINPVVDVLRITNNDPKALKIKYNNQVYVIEPNQTVAVPAAVAFLWFGDPRTSGSVPTFQRGEDGRINGMLPARSQEVTRLRFKWGGQLGGDETTFIGCVLPDVTVKDFDGNEIVMVIQDPEGNSSLPMPGGIDPSTSHLAETVQQQQKLIDYLMKKIDGEDRPEAESEDELPTDDASIARPFKAVDLSKGIPAPTLS
jgi:hypothetical protein